MGEFDYKSPGLYDSFFFETPLSYDCVSNLERVYSGDIGRWAVRLGRHGLEMVSSPPKGQLRWDRDPP